MNILYKIINWLCIKLNYVPENARKEIELLQLTADKSLEEVSKLLQKSTEELTKTTLEIKELHKHVENSKVLEMEELQQENIRLMEENEKIKNDLKESNKYFEKVEAQVSEYLHSDPIFGFKRSMCFPGASTFTSFSRENSIYIAGRIVLEDSVSAQMQQLASVSERYYLAHNRLIKYGLLERMAKDAAAQGGIAYTLGYNKDCTATELYYAMEIKKQEAILEIKNNDTEG